MGLWRNDRHMNLPLGIMISFWPILRSIRIRVGVGIRRYPVSLTSMIWIYQGRRPRNIPWRCGRARTILINWGFLIRLMGWHGLISTGLCGMATKHTILSRIPGRTMIIYKEPMESRVWLINFHTINWRSTFPIYTDLDLVIGVGRLMKNTAWQYGRERSATIFSRANNRTRNSRNTTQPSTAP